MELIEAIDVQATVARETGSATLRGIARAEEAPGHHPTLPCSNLGYDQFHNVGQNRQGPIFVVGFDSHVEGRTRG